MASSEQSRVKSPREVSRPFSLAAGPDNRIYFAVSRQALGRSDERHRGDFARLCRTEFFRSCPAKRPFISLAPARSGSSVTVARGQEAEFELSSVAVENAETSLGASSALAQALALAPPHSGIVVGADGTLFVADTQDSTIRTIAGAESSEPMITRSLVGKWAGASDVELIAPTALAMDTSGNLYIADVQFEFDTRLSQ